MYCYAGSKLLDAGLQEMAEELFQGEIWSLSAARILHLYKTHWMGEGRKQTHKARIKKDVLFYFKK